MLAGEVTDYCSAPGPVVPRQGKRVLWKFFTVRDVDRGGQCRPFADLMWSNYLA